MEPIRRVVNVVEGKGEAQGGIVCEEKSLWISVYRQPHPMPNGPGQSR